MKTTYNEILNSMKNTFFNECGENVQSLSDVGARFKAVASELFSISCYGDYILKQSFPQTATGDYLDFHAELRGIRRRTATRARGNLVFEISEPAQADIVISEGTICALEESPYIQFSTDESTTITAGNTTATVKATAISCGEDYNVPAGAITVMVNPPIGVSTVSNRYSFRGGYNGESDTELRRRLLASYSVAPNGLGIEMLKSAVLDIDDVLDCNIVYTNGSLKVYYELRTGEISNAITKAIKSKLMLVNIFGVPVNVYAASRKSYSLDIEVNAQAEAERHIRSAVSEFARSVHIGESIKLYKLISIVSAIDGVQYCNITSDNATGGIITCSNDELLKLADTGVNYIE